MSWGSWARRAYVLGAGFALASAAFLIVPIGSDAVAPPATPTSAAPSQPLSIDLGGLAVSVGGINIDVGSVLDTTPVGKTVASTVKGVVDSLTGATQPAAAPPPVPTQPVAPPTPGAPSSSPPSSSPQPTSQPTRQPTTAPPAAPTPTQTAPVRPVASRARARTQPARINVDNNVQNVSSHTQIHRPDRTQQDKPVEGLGPVAQVRHRERPIAEQILANALHPGKGVLALAAFTALIAVGIAAMVVSFGRRPGVSITGRMVE